MKKRIFISLFILFISFLGSIGFAIYTIENEEYHQSPCESSARLLTDSLRKQYNIWGWSSYPKNFCSKCDDYDSNSVDCSIIICELKISEPELDFQQDSIIYNIMSLFWSFPQNKVVDSLYLTISNSKYIITTALKKSDLKKLPQKVYYDSYRNFTEFKITDIIDGMEYGGGGEYKKYEIKTRELKVLSQIDLIDYHSVAEYFHTKELKRCKRDDISTLTIKIETINPNGQFLTSKTNNYTFEIVPFINYHQKKRSL